VPSRGAVRRKQFFFEKKNQKLLSVAGGAVLPRFPAPENSQIQYRSDGNQTADIDTVTDKSFLFLFFKKEILPSLCQSGRELVG
jgi:hypothetical protein